VAFGIPVPTREFKFHPKRRWRVDYAWPDLKLAVEIEGGAFVQGRHFRGVGAIKDMEKYNELVFMGYRLLRFTPDQVKKGDAVRMIVRCFEEKRCADE